MFHFSNLILYTQMSKKSLIFVGNTFISLVTSVIISEPVVNAIDSVNFCLENGKASTIRTICSNFKSFMFRHFRSPIPVCVENIVMSKKLGVGISNPGNSVVNLHDFHWVFPVKSKATPAAPSPFPDTNSQLLSW